MLPAGGDDEDDAVPGVRRRAHHPSARDALVVRMGVEAATETLEAAGFRVQVEQTSLYIGIRYVVGTDPSGGTKAPRGSTVVVRIV